MQRKLQMFFTDLLLAFKQALFDWLTGSSAFTACLNSPDCCQPIIN